MSFSLRRAHATDAPHLAAIFMAARARMVYLPALYSDAETRAFIAHVVATQEVWLALAPETKQDRVIGFAAIHDLPNEIWLDHLYVAPQTQGQGAGKALLDVVKTQRPQGFSLHTFQQNMAARRFYQRHGLTLAQTTDGRDNEEKLPDCLYVWRGSQKTQTNKTTGKDQYCE